MHKASECTGPPGQEARGSWFIGATAPTVRGGDQTMDLPPVRALSKRWATSAQLTMFQKALT